MIDEAKPHCGLSANRSRGTYRRFATAGSIQEALCRAGFRNVQEQHVTLPRIWAGSAQQLWEYFQEIDTLFQPLLRAIPAHPG